MKGLVLSIHSMNYGNRLQNYAVNHLLKKISIEPENIVVGEYLSKEKNPKRRIIKRCLPVPLYRKLVEYLTSQRNSLEDEKERCFLAFSECYMQNTYVYGRTPKEISRQIKRKMPKDAWVFLGSDQIWNPDFAGDGYFFGDFAKESKRLSFAASIGYSNLPEERIKKYTSYWNSMKFISVREASAAKMIEQTIGKKPEVFLDPTLLLTREEWDEIIQKPAWANDKPYVLCLFLGRMPEHLRHIKKEMKETSFIVLNDKSHRDYYLTDPSQFLWLVKNAQMILTDSFHCTVFSMIYHKNFWVFDRKDVELKSMFTRMENLLDWFGFRDRIYEGNMEYLEKDIEKKRFLEADALRGKEQKRVLSVIKSVIEEEKGE